jgi:hypothetical protein
MICYLVQAHHQPDHHERLIRTLTADGDVVLTHVDAKADQSAFATVPNASFTEERIRVSWRGFSQVRATLILLAEARRRHPDASHYWFISGDSYPLRPPRALRAMVDAHPGRQLLSVLPFPAPEMGKPESRLSGLWIEHDPRHRKLLSLVLRVIHRTVRLPYRRALGDLSPLCGSNWFTLTADAVDALLEQVGARKSFRRLCERTSCADEHYLHTLLGATEFLADTAPAGMYADFESPTGPWPNALTSWHVQRLAAATPGRADERYGASADYFARKFTDATSEALISEIHQHLWPLPIPDPVRHPIMDHFLAENGGVQSHTTTEAGHPTHAC